MSYPIIIPTNIQYHSCHFTLLLKLCWDRDDVSDLFGYPSTGLNTPPTPHPPSLDSKVQVTQHHGGEERRTFTFSLGVFLRVIFRGQKSLSFSPQPNPFSKPRVLKEKMGKKKRVTCGIFVEQPGILELFCCLNVQGYQVGFCNAPIYVGVPRMEPCEKLWHGHPSKTGHRSQKNCVQKAVNENISLYVPGYINPYYWVDFPIPYAC